MNEQLLFTGGIFNLGFGIFHLFFWKLFDWKNDLASLSFINRNVMQVWKNDLASLSFINRNVMQVLNLCLAFVFFVFAYISVFHSSEMLTTGLGSALIFAISIFWFLRAIEQIIFFTLRKPISWILFILFLLGGASYGALAIKFV